MDTGGVVELGLPLFEPMEYRCEELYVPQWPKESTFLEEEVVVLEPDEKANVRHDVSTRVETISGVSGGIHEGGAKGGAAIVISERLLAMLDWERIHGELLSYRDTSGYRNLLIPADALRKIMAEDEAPRYELVAPVELVQPKRFEDVRNLERVVTDILRGYVDKFYRLSQRRWDAKHLDWAQVKEAQFQGYSVRVPARETELIKSVRKLIKEREKRFKETWAVLSNLYFDRHVYQPLLLEPSNELKITPPGLNESEQLFVEDLKAFCAEEQEKSLKGKKLFLLRNLSKGKGVGFFEERGFFPDFILWVKDGKDQRIIFVEPHGMVHEDHPQRNEKVGLHKRLQEDTAEALKRLKHVSLDAYVVSKTPYSKLRNKWVHDDKTPWSREDCAADHVLFMETRTASYDYIKRLLMA